MSEKKSRLNWGDDDLQIAHRPSFNMAEHLKLSKEKVAGEKMVPLAELTAGKVKDEQA